MSRQFARGACLQRGVAVPWWAGGLGVPGGGGICCLKLLLDENLVVVVVEEEDASLCRILSCQIAS